MKRMNGGMVRTDRETDGRTDRRTDKRGSALFGGPRQWRRQGEGARPPNPPDTTEHV